MTKERIASIFLILIVTGGLFSCRKADIERTGGQCIYENDPVTILVKKIEPEKLSRDREILSISYEMTFDEGFRKGEIENGAVDVSPAQAKEKGVETGKKFHASFSRLVSGTCNPEPIYPDLKDWK